MSPSEEYSARLEQFRAQEQLLEKRFKTIGNWRLATGIALAALAWFVFAQHKIPAAVLLIPVVALVALIVLHQRVIRERTLASRAATFYERGLARLQNRWAGTGSTGERFRDPSHVYAEDLDLFGKGSLFELLSQARTAAGQQLLASWLLEPGLHKEALERQQACRELSGNLRLREDLAVLAEDIGREINVTSLGVWGKSEPVRFPAYLPYVAPVLALAGLAAIVSVFAQLIPLSVLLAIFLCDAAVIFPLRKRVHSVLEGIESTGREVKIFSAIIQRLEREQFSSPILQAMQDDLEIAGQPASRRIARLSRLVDWLDSSDHILVRALRPLLLWQEQLAMSFERWRGRSGAHVESWVHAVAQFEALSSLASLAYEHPEWCTPELFDSAEPLLQAEGLKHPLLPASECVANDLSLGFGSRMLIVSGSNMSGKSTLLRSTGLNAVLAWAGAPVAATRFQVSRLQTGASIRLNDSLQDHRSRFFAEISRIRQIMDLTRAETPVLFLLDEVLSGTNSHDRRLGAAGIVRELLKSAAIGLITTHDLALASIEGDVTSGVTNVHFEDHMDGAQMLFDYKLKPGVVRRSNALELMRAVGLQV